MQPNEQQSLIISYLNIHNEQPFDEEINLDSFLFFHENNTEFVKRINLIKDFLVDFHVEFGTPDEYEKAKDSSFFRELL